MKKILAAVIGCVMLFANIGSALASTYVNSGKGINFSEGISSVAEYNGYLYTIASTSGLRILDARDINNIQDVTPDSADYKGTCGSHDPVRMVLVDGDRLFAAMNANNQDVFRVYTLTNPAAPALQYSINLEGGTAKTMAGAGDFAFVAGYAHLTAVNLQNGQYKIFNDWLHKDYKMIEYADGYLYCIADQGGNKNGYLDIYDMRSIATGFPSNSVGNERVGRLTFPELEIADIVVYNGYAMINGWSSNWMDRHIYVVDVSNPANIGNVDVIKYPAEGSIKRINDMVIHKGMMFATDIDNTLHMYDVTDPTNIREVVTQGMGNNHYTGVLADGNYIVSDGNAISFFPYYVTEVTIDSIENGDQITARPIRVGGKAPGSEEVEVSVGGVKAVAEVDELGYYLAEIDDEFIDPGEHEIKAVVTSGSQKGEAAVTANINITPAKYEITESQLSPSETGVQASLSIRNNNALISEAVFVSAMYKNQQMIGYNYETKAMPLGLNTFSAPITSGETEGAELAAYLLAKNAQGNYTLIWQQKTNNQVSTGSPAAAEGLTIDVAHEDRQVTMKMTNAGLNGRDTLFMVFHPDGQAMGNLEYIGTVKGANNAAQTSFILPTDAAEDRNYTVLASAKGAGQYLYQNSTFKYYGAIYIRPILESIVTAQPGDGADGTIGQILADNSQIFAIEMGEGSAFAALGEQYQNNVYEAIRGQDFTQTGSLGLKNAFNAAVAAQTEQQETDRKISVALAAINDALAGTNENDELFTQIFAQAEVLGVDTAQDSILESLKAPAKAKVFNRLKKAARYGDITILKNDIETFAALEYVNQTPYTQLGPVMRKVKDVLGLNFGEYPYANNNDNATIHKDISLQYDYETARELQDALTKAIRDLKNSKRGSGGNGGNGGNGGKPVVSMPVMVDVPITEDKITEYTYEFLDLDNVEWARTAVEELAKREIVAGKGENKFDPLANVTREEFVKMVVSALEIPLSETEVIPFDDVEATDWSAPYIVTAYEMGIVQGVDENNFNKKAKITRQDMAVILYRALEKTVGCTDPETTVSFTDELEISAYAQEAVAYMGGCGIMSGVGDGYFAPKANANRAMAAQVIYNAVVR